MGIAREIRLIRQQAFLTQEEFARDLRVAFSTLNRWETGKTIPNLSSLRRIKTFCKKNSIPFDTLKREWLLVSCLEDDQNSQ